MSKILEDLVRFGVPVETIMAVARLVADAELTQRRRERSRANANASRMSKMSQHEQTRDDTKPLKVGIEDQKDRKKGYTPRRRKLDPDFAPDRSYALAKGWSETTVDLEIERFKNHARASGRRQLDWQAAWRNWVTSPFQTNGGSNGRASAPRNGSREHRQEATARAISALANYQGGGCFDDEVPPVGLPLPEPDGP